MSMLKQKEVTPDKLLLDPNNPRLIENFQSQVKVEDELAESKQESLLALFNGLSDLGNEFTDIKDLKKSMEQIGFVQIQNIVVREIAGTGKYIVIEGNRRVATIKTLLKDHELAAPGRKGRIEDLALLASLQTLEVMILQTNGRSEDEIRNEEKTILGLRHIGGNLEWDPLAKGKNIYDEYMKLDPAGAAFSWDSTYGNRIARILAINYSPVKKSLMNYLCWVQLGKFNSNVNSRHFSLISDCVSNTNFRTYDFITIDETTFELSSDSLSKINEICEFDHRDNRASDDWNILKDSTSVSRLGTILKDSKFDKSSSVRDRAKGIFQEVLDRQIKLDDAYSELTAFKKQSLWVDSVNKLLDKQEKLNKEELRPDKFLNQGTALQEKIELEHIVKRFLLLMNS